MKTQRSLGFALVLAFMFSGSAFAYVPPSHYMIQKLAAKRSKFRGYRIKSRINGLGIQLKEILFVDVRSRELKARILNAQDQEIYAYEKKWDQSGSLTSLVNFESNPTFLSRALALQGIPVLSPADLSKFTNEEEKRAQEKTKLGRADGKIGWVIGDGYPSFWILKDDFTPFKLSLKSGGKEIDVKFDDTKIVREFPYARSISLFEGSEFVLKGEAIEISINPEVSDMKAIQVSGVPTPPSNLDSTTVKLIENWVQWIR